MCCFKLSFLAKNRISATMAIVPACTMVHSQVAVLLPVGEARAMHSSIFKTEARRMHTPRRSHLCKPSMSHKIDRLDLGYAFNILIGRNRSGVLETECKNENVTSFCQSYNIITFLYTTLQLIVYCGIVR